jgi:hypothetical protein
MIRNVKATVGNQGLLEIMTMSAILAAVIWHGLTQGPTTELLHSGGANDVWDTVGK